MEGLKKTNIAKFQFDHSKIEEQLKSIRNNVTWFLNIVISIPCDIIFRWFHDWHATEDETGRGEAGQVRSVEGTFPFSLPPSDFVLLYRIMFIISGMEAAWPSAFDALFSAWSPVKLAFLFHTLGAGLARWWECSPPINVAQVRFRPSTMRGLNLALLRGFSFLHKINIFKFQFNQGRESAWKPAKGDQASFLNIIIYSLFTVCFLSRLSSLNLPGAKGKFI